MLININKVNGSKILLNNVYFYRKICTNRDQKSAKQVTKSLL